MATETVPVPAEAHQFFDLMARYMIDPDARIEHLVNDFQCLFASGVGAFEEGGTDDFTHTQWAGLFMLRQAGAVFDEIARKLDRKRAEKEVSHG